MNRQENYDNVFCHVKLKNLLGFFFQNSLYWLVCVKEICPRFRFPNLICDRYNPLIGGFISSPVIGYFPQYRLEKLDSMSFLKEVKLERTFKRFVE